MAEIHSPASVRLFGESATGTIDPEVRKDISLEIVDEISRRLDEGDFLMPTEYTIPCGCVDGRLCGDGTRRNAPNAAGGTLSLVIADALTGKDFDGETVCDHMSNIAEFLVDTSDPMIGVGLHGDTHAGKEGCGANSKLPKILEKIISNGEDIRQFLKSRGIYVNDSLHENILSRADELLKSGYTRTAGEPVINAASSTAGEKIYEIYDGGHNEVKLNLNSVAHTTLDRAALREEYGSGYQAFNVDIWALKEASKVISNDAVNAEDKFIASLYFNSATAMTLAGPGLRT